MKLFKLTRRQFVLAGLGAGAVLGVGAYGGWRLWRRRQARRRVTPPREQPFAAGAFVAIDARGEVTVWLQKPDIGQGVHTTLPMIVADELGADPARIRVVQAPADNIYGNQFVGVSMSVRGSYQEMRIAGAAARQMLVEAAAESLQAPARECRAESGFVVHAPSGRKLSFAELVPAAARRPLPQAPALKPASEFRLIGKSMPRPDLPAKIDGSARFGLDVRVAGMAYAAVARPPAFGARAGRFDAAPALAVPGVRRVLAVETGVAVLADHTHAAFLGRDALSVQWQGGDATLDSRAIDARLQAGLAQAGAVARREGQGADALKGEGRIVRAEYRLPYLAHATMEPMNCTADVRADQCVVWAPVQSPQDTRDAIARKFGIDPARIVVNIPFIGGGFGRRIERDFVLEAVEVSRAAGRPVQVVWSREDDLRHDWYRPCSLHQLEARLGADGLPVALRHRIVSPSILKRDPNFRGEFDPTAVEGAREIPYRVANLQVEHVVADLPLPTGFWRSVGHSYNAFAVECFLDEIAAAAGRSPAELRRTLLAGQPRHLGVLERALKEAGAAPAGEGRGRGVAVHASFGSYVAMVADVRLRPSGAVAVERVVCAADAGFAVDPDGTAAQLEGAIAFGLTAALYGRVEVAAGGVATGNFDDYPLLRIDEMPRVEVHLVDGAPGTLGGVGEIGVPPIAPAVCNAIRAAGGAPVRALPLVGRAAAA